MMASLAESNVQNMIQLFHGTFHAQPQTRMQAEMELNKMSINTGFLSMTLQLIASPQIDVPVRQAASIFFKNIVKRNWAITAEDLGGKNAVASHQKFMIQETDKQFVRANILSTMVNAPNVLQTQLGGALGVVLSEDHPHKWTSFITDLLPFLNSSEALFINVGLAGLRELVKVYRWKTVSDRAPLTKTIKSTFPQLLVIANGLLVAPMEHHEAALMLKNAIKIYYGTIEYEFPKVLREDAVLVQWCTFLLNIIAKPLHVELLPTDREEREKYIWWKVKKWAYRCLYKIFNRYGNPALETFREGTYKSFAKTFMEKYAGTLMTAIFAQTEVMIAMKLNVPEKVLFTVFSFYTDFLKHKITWNLMKPHLEPLVNNLIYPRLCFNDEEKEIWEEDPIEYIQKKVDPFEDFNSSAGAASALLVSMVKDRFKQTFMMILQFINNRLGANAQPSNEQMARQKDGALAMLASLAETVLSDRSEVKSQIGTVLINFVLPDLQSPYPFLRSRSCQVIIAYCQYDDSNSIQMGDHVWLKVFEQLLHLVAGQNEVPVRVYAALALEHVVACEGVAEAVSQHAGPIMKELLKLTSELDLESLTTVMERFVEMFPNELTPYSLELCTQLRDQYMRIMTEAMAKSGPGEDPGLDWDESGEKVMAAMGILKTIGTMILSIQADTEAQKTLLVQLEEVVLPAIAFTLENEIVDLIDDVFELVDSITYQLKGITQNMWQLFELVYKAVMGYAIDFIEEIFPSLDNYISYGSDLICQQPRLQEMLFSMIQHVLTSDSLSTDEQLLSFKLMESMLLHCRGRIDGALEPFMKMAFERLQDPRTLSTGYFVHCLEVAVNALYYNPVITLTIMESNGWTKPFFSLWFSSHQKLTRVHDKKLGIVALLSLIQLAASDSAFQQLPESVRAGWPHVMKSLLQFFSTLPKAIEAREELEKMHGEDSDDDDDDDDDDEDGEQDETTAATATDVSTSGQTAVTSDDEDGCIEYDDNEDGSFEEAVEDDEDVPDDEAEYLEFLARKAASKDNSDDGEDGDDDEEDWSQELGEELYFTTPLDDLDVYEMFRSVINAVQSHAPSAYNLLNSELNQPERELAQTVFSKPPLPPVQPPAAKMK